LAILMTALVTASCAAPLARWQVEQEAGDRLLDRGRLEEAAARYAAAVQAAEVEGSAQAQFFANASLADLWTTYPQLGHEEQVPKLWLHVLALAEEAWGVEHHNVGFAASRLAHSYTLLGRWAEAVPYYAGAAAVFEAVHGPDDASTEGALHSLEQARRQAGDQPVEVSKLAQRLRAAETAAPETDAAPGVEISAEPDSAPRPAASRSYTINADATYLRLNAQDTDGTWAFVHVTEADMPLRIAIGRPHVGARDGSREDARDAAIEGMRMWERGLQPHLAWFEFEFVEDEEPAAVQVTWKRRMLGSAVGRAGIRFRREGDQLRVGGRMDLGIVQFHSNRKLTMQEVRMLTAHEFGHVLGLPHCFDCNSIMSYNWETENRVLVTDLDVLTFRALVERPNGLRADGRLMRGLTPSEPDAH
jgi:tetratricopeptide (TPR) repeat protein